MVKIPAHARRPSLEIRETGQMPKMLDNVFVGLTEITTDDHALVLRYKTPVERDDARRLLFDLLHLCPENDYAFGRVESPDCQGYHPIAVLADGELLCEHCVNDPTNPVTDHRVTTDPDEIVDGWHVVGWINSGDLDGDGDQEGCAHCGRTWP